MRTIVHLSDLHFGRLAAGQFLLASTWIVKPFPENGLDVQIDDDQILFELLSSSDQFPVLVENETVAVEHQLILSANEIVIGDDDGVVSGPGRKHAFPPSPFAGMVRR